MPYADPEKNKAKCRERYAANRQTDIARRKAAYQANLPREKAKRREWYEARREAFDAYLAGRRP